MITLSTAHDYIILFAFAGLFGAIGGIAYELTRTHSKETGMIELPGFRGKRLVELGFISSMLLGGIAAVAVSYFFTPEVQVKSIVNGVSTIQTKWQIVKVIPLSLIVGSAGGAFLEAMRSRVLGQLNAQKVAGTQAASNGQVEQLANIAKAVVAGGLGKAGSTITSGIAGHVAEAADSVPQDLKLFAESADVTGSPVFAEVSKRIAAARAAEPAHVYLSRINDVVTQATADENQSAIDAINAAVKSAHDAIDAAATANAT
jgi:hypothetical protein